LEPVFKHRVFDAAANCSLLVYFYNLNPPASEWNGMPCGIAGLMGLSDKELLSRMLSVQRHRGPDSAGQFVDSGIALGADRLKVIDLPKGNQPIHNEDGSVWIVYNGEVYNYRELRPQLESEGHRFYTDSDTETVVHAYEEWGTSCLERFRGMFAFALWDSNRRLLFLARDRLGKKPLYYAVQEGALLFSSELKGILQYEGLKREVDWAAVDHFFAYSYVPSPLTIFKQVRKLPPGHYLTYDGREARVRKYWSVDFNPVPQEEGAAVDRLYSILSEAVRLRLRSDVPLGAFLSGGIDSSVVTAMMSRVSPEPIKTVTVGFDEQDAHVRMGRLVADSLNTDHRQYIVDATSLDVLPELLWHFDEPFADPSLIPTYHVSMLTRQVATVAITGDGGDEMFMGYDFLSDPPVYSLYKAVPTPVRRAGLKLLVNWPGQGDWKKMANYALQRDYGEQDNFGRYLLRSMIFTPDELSSVYRNERGIAPVSSFLESSLKECTSRDYLDIVNHATFKGYLSEMILPKVDRMSMAVSLEARCPLLDQELAEFVFTLPSSLKRKAGVPKYIFKRMALTKGLVPAEVIQRKKLGFGAPVAKWFGKEWNEIGDQLLDKAKRQGIISQTLLSDLARDKFLNSAKLFAVSSFTLWYSQYIENDGSSPTSLDRLISG